MKHAVTKTKNKQAFTLIEMSIVLTIIALLVGGVLAGQSLIRASELRAFMSQYQSFMTAIDAFKDKYGSIPGDMDNATGYWGAAAAGTTCITTASITATCNGNGDKLITDPVGGGQSSNELFRFWQHLAVSGFIGGSYDGITHGTTTYSATTDNSPAGKIRNTLWFTYPWGDLTSASVWFDGNYANSLEFGTAVVNADPSGAVFKPEELWNIDTKIDDGKPATGKLKMRGTLNSCTDTSINANMAANYLVSNNTVACTAIFPNAY